MTIYDHTLPHRFKICLKRVVLHRSSTLSVNPVSSCRADYFRPSLQDGDPEAGRGATNVADSPGHWAATRWVGRSALWTSDSSDLIFIIATLSTSDSIDN